MKNIKRTNVLNFPNNLTQIEREVEAIIFAAAEPLDVDTIESKISKRADVKKILDKLKGLYTNRGINLVCISEKWSFRTANNLSDLMSKQKTVEKKLSKAAIETLSIIVYHQPVTRAEIEDIRGVSVSTRSIRSLLERNWIKVSGFRDVPGRPALYVTTKDFLDDLNLKNISDLPALPDIKDTDDQDILSQVI